MKHLLDVNVLLAAIWQQHPDFAKADAWLAGRQVATCALSELGFLRVSTHQKALKADMTASRQLLHAFLEKHKAQFVPAGLPALKSSARKSEEPPRIARVAKWASVRMNMAIHGPFLRRPLKSRLGSDCCFGSGRIRSRVVRNVMTNRTTQTIAHRPMVICQPLALLPCPNLATRGSVKPTTISCAIMAETKRKDERRVRSLTSPVDR